MSWDLPDTISIRDVGPRDGLQPEQPVRVADRVALITALVDAGVNDVEAAAFVVLAVVLLWLTLTGDPESVPRALAEVVLVAGVAVVLGAAAAGLRRLAGWARGPVIALQILFAASGVVAFQAGRPEFGVPALVLAAATIYLLMTPEARLAYLDR